MTASNNRKRSRPTALTDLPVDVIRLIQDKARDATTRLRLQSVLPKPMRAPRDTDSLLSLLEFCNRKGRLVGHNTMMHFLYDLKEESAHEILQSMPGYQGFKRGRNLEAAISTQDLSITDLPTEEDIETDAGVAYHAMSALGGVTPDFFDEFVKTETFGRIKERFNGGFDTMYRKICILKNASLFDHVRSLAVDDPWFTWPAGRSKCFAVRRFEAEMAGDLNEDLFFAAATDFNTNAARELFAIVVKNRPVL
jgi:hypothetical protein